MCEKHVPRDQEREMIHISTLEVMLSNVVTEGLTSY